MPTTFPHPARGDSTGQIPSTDTPLKQHHGRRDLRTLAGPRHAGGRMLPQPDICLRRASPLQLTLWPRRSSSRIQPDHLGQRVEELRHVAALAAVHAAKDEAAAGIGAHERVHPAALLGERWHALLWKPRARGHVQERHVTQVHHHIAIVLPGLWLVVARAAKDEEELLVR
eukprot:941340-Prymnesium_polylepis.1